jgi:hypothetical protein
MGVSASFRLATPGETVRLSWRAEDGNTGLFPQAVVVNESGTVVSTVNLSSVSLAGVVAAYEGNYVPTTTGEFNIYYSVYTSSANRTAQTPVSEMYGGGTDVLKVRFFPVQSMGASFSGMTDDDLAAFVKELNKLNFWSQILSSGRTAEQELLAKSEFDAQTQIVKTDVVIPQVDLNPILTGLRQVESSIPTLQQIKKEVSSSEVLMSKQIIQSEESLQNFLGIFFSTLEQKVSALQPLIIQADNAQKLEEVKNLLVQQWDDLGALQGNSFVSLSEDVKINHQKLVDLVDGVSSQMATPKMVDMLSQQLSGVLDMLGQSTQIVQSTDKESRDKVIQFLSHLKDDITQVLSKISNIEKKNGIMGKIEQLTSYLSG